jgi:hypothetical protein
MLSLPRPSFGVLIKKGVEGCPQTLYNVNRVDLTRFDSDYLGSVTIVGQREPKKKIICPERALSAKPTDY